MIQRGEYARPATWTERAAAPARLRAIALFSEIAIGSADATRIGLVALALGLQTIVLYTPGHFRPAGMWYFAVLVTGGTFVSLGLALAATLPLRPWLALGARQTVAIAGLAVICILAVMGTGRTIQGVSIMAVGQPYSNDGAVMDLYAAERVIAGHNPYQRANIVQALAAMNAPCTTTTPLMAGQFRGAQSYPSENSIQSVCMNA